MRIISTIIASIFLLLFSHYHALSCWEHSDCAVHAPFCYLYGQLAIGYCTDCMYCQWCTDGVDDTCGNGCGQTTYYGASCDTSASTSTTDISQFSLSHQSHLFPSADECDWVQTNVNDYGQYPLGNNATVTANECIYLAWNNNCEIANYHDASQTCKCQSGEDRTVEYGSGYRSCFVDEWRNDRG